jgi:hypothetical protein
MNRAVEERLYRSSHESFGYFILHVIDHYKEVYEKNKDFYKQQGKKANPIELAKYGVRTHSVFTIQGERTSLLELQQCNDPLQIVQYSRFSGKFAYDENEKAYRPIWTNVKGTELMKGIYDKIEEKRIERAWDKAKKYLETDDDEEAKLCY